MDKEQLAIARLQDAARLSEQQIAWKLDSIETKMKR